MIFMSEKKIKDKIYEYLKSQPNAKTISPAKVKIISSSYYIGYNALKKSLSIGTETSSGHYARIVLYPDRVIVKTKIGENDYFTVRVKKPINISRFVYKVESLAYDIETALKSEGVEIE